MVAYEITAVVEPHLAEAYEHFMRREHIPHLMATGCFVSASLARSSAGRYRIRYEAESQAELDRYLATHAAHLRGEFNRHFPAGVTLAREVWAALERWAPPG